MCRQWTETFKIMAVALQVAKQQGTAKEKKNATCRKLDSLLLVSAFV